MIPPRGAHLLIALACLVLTGCAKPAPAPDVVVWTGMTDTERATLSGIAREFTRRSGISVSIQQVPFADLRLKYQIAAPAGLGPDLLTGPQDWVGMLATAGLIGPLQEGDVPAADRQQFSRPGLDALTYLGNLYGLPYSLEAVALIYNKQLLPQVPDTWDGLVAEASRLTRDKQHGLLFAVDNLYFAWPFFSGCGAHIFGRGPNGQADYSRVGLDSPEGVAAATLLQDLIDRKRLMFPGVDEAFSRQLFAQGKAAAIIDGPWAVGDIRGSGVSYGVAALPRLPNGQVPRPFVGVYGTMLNARTRHRSQAVAFMQFMTDRENQVQLSASSARLPARRDSLDLVAGKPDIVAFARSADSGEPMPNHPAMQAVWEPAGNALKLIINSRADPRQALEDAARRIQEDIGQMME